MNGTLRRFSGIAGLLGCVLLLGCGAAAELLISYTGGGLPPGDPDIGGVVLAEAPSAAATTAQAQTPVVGAVVELFRGNRKVGSAVTGAGGYFRFERPDTGSYRIEVTPPQGSGLRRAQRNVQHQAGHQTFTTIILERE